MFTLEEIQDTLKSYAMLDELVPWEVISIKEDFILLLYDKHLPVINHIVRKNGIITFHPTTNFCIQDIKKCIYCRNAIVPEEFILSAKLIYNES